MAEQQESYSSASSKALAPFRGQQQSSTGSSGVGFGGGGFGSQSIGFGHAVNHVRVNNPFGGSTAGFRIGGFPPGNITANTTSVFGRNVSGFSMTFDGTNLKIDLAPPGSFGRSPDNVFAKYPADSDGTFGGAGSAFDKSHPDPIGFSGFQYAPLAAAQYGATTSQVPQTEDFQAHIEKEKDNLTQTFHFKTISASKAFRNLSFEELRLVDYHQGRYGNGIPGHGFISDPKLGSNLAQSSLFGGLRSSDNAFVSYPANSGSFGVTGSDLGTAGLSSFPYSPPAAQDGTPVQVPLTEDYQGYSFVEYGSIQTSYYQAITSSTPFMNFSFEELRLVDYQQGRQRNALPAHGFTTNSNTSDNPFPKFPSIAFTGNTNSMVTSSPTSPTSAFGSDGIGAAALFRPSFAFGQRKLPPSPSGAFGIGNLPSFTLSATSAGSQGTFNHPFQAYAEQEPSHQYCYQTLGFLNPYKNSSFEELRLADFNQGRRKVVAFDGPVGSPGAGQLKLDNLFGKPIVPSGQLVGTTSPFSADQISTAIAQISNSGNSSTGQWRGFAEAIPSGGRSSETTNRGHEAASLSREITNEANSPNNDTPSPKLPGSPSEASEETKPQDSCNQQ